MKRRKNPIGLHLMDKMLDVITGYGLNIDINDIKQSFARMLSCKSSNDEFICDDCEEWYTECTCEGDRELKDAKGYNLPCRYCKQNYCICDYNLKTQDDIIKEVANLAKHWFDKEQIDQFIYLINDRYKTTFGKKSKEGLMKLLNLIERKSNPKRKLKRKKISKK